MQMKIKCFLASLFFFFLTSVSWSQSPTQPKPALPATTPQPLTKPARTRVIVFVHGIHGDRNSWRNPNGAYWPDLVRADPRFAFSDVEVAEYPTPDMNGKMSSLQLSDVLYNRLRQDHVWDHREVVFIAHSLGGILVEEMLLRHPADAAKVRFIVSYGTPHEGSPIARLASFYDRDPLLSDLSDTSNNSFLPQLEDNWRRSNSVNGIHRFCAYEGLDTAPDNVFGRYLRTHARVVSYYSATYGCDVTTPPQEIHADHGDMIRPPDRKSAAYDFFYRVYRDNPVLQEQIVARDNVIGGLEAACDRTNSSNDLQVPIALDSNMHEKVLAATATFINAVELHDINPNPPVVTKVDPNGVAHVLYGFRGPGKKLFVCLGNAHTSLMVEFKVDQQVPMREPQN